jgi:imidazolonepropionase-like amidohydrolase
LHCQGRQFRYPTGTGVATLAATYAARGWKIVRLYGVVEPGMLADLVIVDANPFANLKVLYGTGWFRLNDNTGKVEQYGGVKYTIKDGIVYDAKQLLADIEKMGDAQRRGGK